MRSPLVSGPSVGGTPGPGAPVVTRAGAHHVLLTSGAQLLPDLWRERWNTMVTRQTTPGHLTLITLSFFQVLFLASLLLSSCHGQEYPTKVDLSLLQTILLKICSTDDDDDVLS